MSIKNEVLQVEIIKHSEYATLERNGDLIDLNFCEFKGLFQEYVIEDGDVIRYPEGAIFKVSLGVAMKLPPNKKACIYPRSGTRKNFNVILTNSVGQIDNAYQGSNDIWMAEFYAVKDGTMRLGDRILQFDIVDVMPEVKFIEVDELVAEDRGGFGSTGI